MEKPCRQVCSGRCRVWLELHSDLQLFQGLLVLRLCSVDEAEKLMRFEALRYLRQKPLQLSCSVGKISCFVLGDCRLKFAIQSRSLVVLGCSEGCTQEEGSKDDEPEWRPLAHETPLQWSREHARYAKRSTPERHPWGVQFRGAHHRLRV